VKKAGILFTLTRAFTSVLALGGGIVTLPSPTSSSPTFAEDSQLDASYRCHSAPKHPVSARYQPSLPRIEYLGEARSLGVPDLRRGVHLHFLWHCLSTGGSSSASLIGEKMDSTHPVVRLVLEDAKAVKKFTFPEGIAIYQSDGSKYALASTAEGYYAFTVPSSLTSK
jgi:hypothetical protein